MTSSAWKVSLHGGHSSDYCDHAADPLRAMLEAAIGAGYSAFGVSEHVPRPEERFLYPEERARGWDVAKIASDFDRYTAALPALLQEFAHRLIVLRGFEAEVAPAIDYVARTRAFLARRDPSGGPAFDYFVGSVHYVDEIQIDGAVEEFCRALEACGGLEPLALRYYTTVAAMIETLRPNVVGHLDLIKKRVSAAGLNPADLDTAPVRAAIDHALEAASAYGCILDLNTAGWRKGLGEPYPAPHIVRRAQQMGVPFCFGDDSHRTAEVGAGVDEARAYLLRIGVSTVTVLTREGDPATGTVVKRTVPLE